MDYTLNIRGRLVGLEEPKVMGILNATPDSFFAESRMQTETAVAERTRKILAEGGTMVDVGACSTRPGAQMVSEQEEMERLRHAMPVVSNTLEAWVKDGGHRPIVSVDTFRPNVARMAVEELGADLVNDVSEGTTEMFRMVARLRVPYILTSVQSDLRSTLLTFATKVQQLRDYGQKDIILDPGFGFGKTTEENYRLLNELEKLQVMELPVLVGVSRKSMIYQLLDCHPAEALNGTTMLNTVALMKGAAILRVHDVREAVECVKLMGELKK